VPAIQTDALIQVAEGVSKALAAADPNQEVVVMIIRDTANWGVFDHDFLTSFIAYVKDERLYVHMSRHDWEIPKTRDERLPEPRIGDNRSTSSSTRARPCRSCPIRQSRSTGALRCSRTRRARA
jgi:hypothetical protein